MAEIFRMANELAKHYSYDLYNKLYDACEAKGLFFAEERDGNTLEFWIEDEHYICKEDEK